MYTTTNQPTIVTNLKRSKRYVNSRNFKLMKKRAHRKFRRECNKLLKEHGANFEFPEGYLLTDWDIC